MFYNRLPRGGPKGRLRSRAWPKAAKVTSAAQRLSRHAANVTALASADPKPRPSIKLSSSARPTLCPGKNAEKQNAPPSRVLCPTDDSTRRRPHGLRPRLFEIKGLGRRVNRLANL